jgi:hypothetical protein
MVVAMPPPDFPLAVPSPRAASDTQSHCAVAVQVQVHVQVPAAALSSPRLAPGTSRSSIVHPIVVFVGIVFPLSRHQSGVLTSVCDMPAAAVTVNSGLG